MTPTAITNPVQRTDPRILEQQLAAEIAANSVNLAQLYQANAKVGVVQAWRVVTRSNAVDKAADQWGTPAWGNSPTGEDGTTNLHWVAAWMQGIVAPGSGFPPTFPVNGIAEINILFGGIWYSAASIIAGAPTVFVDKGSTLYGPPPAPPAFTPMSTIVAAPVPSDPITTMDYVGAQITPNVWHVSVFGAIMLSQMPNPNKQKIAAPGDYTQVVSPTMQLVFEANPFMAGGGAWVAL